jgi:hypothetical protein
MELKQSRRDCIESSLNLGGTYRHGPGGVEHQEPGPVGLPDACHFGTLQPSAAFDSRRVVDAAEEELKVINVKTR